ncbi:hypothetical protein [Oxynema aestuarii]|uniref:Uncharacterized protein n=1 Tax=Oxynema aestuarii AP17 TaxID=2064643 RepID=A0A6H1U155_9CYAN|nr:hypothetical protein [Oxynema aestuarii]QIZ72176.1 hypothetical protein HCG48_17685 [Oxynema aestuarii AP17]
MGDRPGKVNHFLGGVTGRAIAPAFVKIWQRFGEFCQDRAAPWRRSPGRALPFLILDCPFPPPTEGA